MLGLFRYYLGAVDWTVAAPCDFKEIDNPLSLQPLPSQD